MLGGSSSCRNAVRLLVPQSQQRSIYYLSPPFLPSPLTQPQRVTTQRHSSGSPVPKKGTSATHTSPNTSPRTTPSFRSFRVLTTRLGLPVESSSSDREGRVGAREWSQIRSERESLVLDIYFVGGGSAGRKGGGGPWFISTI